MTDRQGERRAIFFARCTAKRCLGLSDCARTLTPKTMSIVYGMIGRMAGRKKAAALLQPRPDVTKTNEDVKEPVEKA
jgi:hypothetical protein